MTTRYYTLPIDSITIEVGVLGRQSDAEAPLYKHLDDALQEQDDKVRRFVQPTGIESPIADNDTIDVMLALPTLPDDDDDHPSFTRIWRRSDKFKVPVPHFRLGSSHPCQATLVDRSEYHEDYLRKDLVYLATLEYPETYPQERLCETVEGKVGRSTTLSLPLCCTSSSTDNDRAASEEREETTIEYQTAMAELLEAVNWLPKMPTKESSINTFFASLPHLRAHATANVQNMPELDLDGVFDALSQNSNHDKLCELCSVFSFSLGPTGDFDKGGDGHTTRMQQPIIVDEGGNEITPFLPSFDRMFLNCLRGLCSQCFLVLTLTLSHIGFDTVSEGTIFDRDMPIQCYLYPPVQPLKQYLKLIYEEVQTQSSRHIPAPTLCVRPPHKQDKVKRSPWGSIEVLLEASSLPLPAMQNSGILIKTDGPDLARARHWFSACQRTHGQSCQASKRDVYPGKDLAGYTMRLVDVDRARVIVAEPEASYVALSYVWPRKSTQFKARKRHFENDHAIPESNFLPKRDSSEIYLDLCIDDLPLKIQEAIEITQRIGERHIWIDALCIIQDDKIDVQRTLHRMDKIYKGAKLTLIMANSTGSALKADRGQIKWSVADTTYLLPKPNAAMALERSVWRTRAWTYQEGHFSTCQLVLADDMVYYKCYRSSQAEDRMEGPYHLTSNVMESYESESIDNAYCRHVEAYTGRDLSNQSDILSAFQGLIHDLRATLQDRNRRTEFCWGLPVDSFDGALLWSAAHPLLRRHDSKAPKIGAKRVKFPSWSWAGWKGAVRFRPDYHIDNRSERTVTDGRVDRLGHITTLVTWPWQAGFECPPDGPDLATIFSDVTMRGMLRFVTSVAQVDVGRLRHLFARQGITGWTLDNGTVVNNGWATCLVLSEVENPYIGPKQPRQDQITGRSPIKTYNIMVVKEKRGGLFERRGIVKITQAIWEECEPEIRWVTLI